MAGAKKRKAARQHSEMKPEPETEEVDGLQLVLAPDAASGYRCVYQHPKENGERSYSYQARYSRYSLGYFASAREAAIAVAR